MKTTQTIQAVFSAWETATLGANKALAAGLAEHGITTWEAALPHAMEYVSKRHTIKIVKNLSGKPKLDSSAKSYEAARKAMQRIHEALVPKTPKPKTNKAKAKAPSKAKDIVTQRAEWFGKLDKKSQARFLKLIGK